ncbi:MAG: hypothetical protein ACHQIM_12905 [Sphingobacteriales bacterium]
MNTFSNNIKNKIILLVSFASLISASCSNVYTPALYHQDIVYQPKPASFDTVKAANYFSAGIGVNNTTNSGINGSNQLFSGQFNLSRGYVFNNFNLACGAFGFFGDYKNDVIKQGPNYFSDKFAGAVGGRASADIFISSGNADIRIIGLEAAYSHEYGSYAGFRQFINTNNFYYTDPRTNLFSMGLTSEVIFHNRYNNMEHGIRGFVGTTFGYNELNYRYLPTQETSGLNRPSKIFGNVSYFIKVKKYFATFETGENIFLRVGLTF